MVALIEAEGVGFLAEGVRDVTSDACTNAWHTCLSDPSAEREVWQKYEYKKKAAGFNRQIKFVLDCASTSHLYLQRDSEPFSRVSKPAILLESRYQLPGAFLTT